MNWTQMPRSPVKCHLSLVPPEQGSLFDCWDELSNDLKVALTHLEACTPAAHVGIYSAAVIPMRSLMLNPAVMQSYTRAGS